MSHEQLMHEALQLAHTAMQLGEVPIAAIIARQGKIIGWGWNELVAKRDRTMHAEIAAFRDAAGRYPIDADDLVLVSTLEPCVMCYGAALLSGVSEIVYALRAPADSGVNRVACPDSPEASSPKITGGVFEHEAVGLFQQWLNQHPDDTPQRQYVTQLLILNHLL
jgi:tRNA(adenine34) deaminase